MSKKVQLENTRILELNDYRNFNIFFLFLTYVSTIILIYCDIPLAASICLIISLLAYGTFRYSNYMLLFPFMIYPFMFLIRAQDPENIFIKILPEIIVILGIIFHIYKTALLTKHYKIFLLLIFYSIITLLICLLHVGDISYLFVLIRQNTLPVIFLIVFINASEKNFQLPVTALKLSLTSFAIVGLLALLNITKIFEVEPSIVALHPYLNYTPDLPDHGYGFGRSLNETLKIPRLNFFTGGALGSSAALFCALGFICLYLSKYFNTYKFFLLSFLFFLPGILSLSNSVIISILCLCLTLSFEKNKAITLVFFLPFIILLLFFTNFFIDETPIQYITNSTILGLIKFISDLSIYQILFGVGPRITAAGYLYTPDLFIIDVGILRVFIETGLINFIFFISFIIITFWRGLISIRSSSKIYARPFFYIFFVFILLIHANMTILPPFFPLFTSAVAGIFCSYEFKKKYSSKHA